MKTHYFVMAIRAECVSDAEELLEIDCEKTFRETDYEPQSPVFKTKRDLKRWVDKVVK